jgi:hypothetical protein
LLTADLAIALARKSVIIPDKRNHATNALT